MAESSGIPNNADDALSANDPLDINELASLNDEISDEFIDQLQNKITVSSNIKVKNDGDLFEEPASSEHKSSAAFNSDIDDNFIKKYKAKLKKQQSPDEVDDDFELKSRTVPDMAERQEDDFAGAEQKTDAETPVSGSVDSVSETKPNNIEMPEMVAPVDAVDNQNSIENITGGNIIEKPLNKEMVEYNESLDMLDNNIKYSKYVIYIDPENKDFIDSLTVKERKNLINKIIKEQDSIAITKRRFGNMQAIITHTVVAIITIAIAVPCIYWTINASLEATINNYRSSQVIFGKLYREHGKIKINSSVK